MVSLSLIFAAADILSNHFVFYLNWFCSLLHGDRPWYYFSHKHSISQKKWWKMKCSMSNAPAQIHLFTGTRAHVPSLWFTLPASTSRAWNKVPVSMPPNMAQGKCIRSGKPLLSFCVYIWHWCPASYLGHCAINDVRIKIIWGKRRKKRETGWKRGRGSYGSLLCRSNEALTLSEGPGF